MTVFASPSTKMAQSGSKSQDHVGRSNSHKRHRQPIDDEDDEDIENVMPPNKKMNKFSYPSSGESGIPSSSPLLLSDDGCSTENQDGRDTSFTDSGSEESICHHPPNTSNGVLSSIDNIRNTFRRNRQNSISIDKKCPLPNFSWVDSLGLWRKMYERDSDTANQRSPNLLDNHPSLKIRMRAILLDWLNEVCDVYKLHRETFHLSLNYIDRYLSCTENVHKNRLQLIGITCLFIAAKVEEIYPPKITEFAYVTDCAFTQEEILLEEIVILSALHWNISLITANNWLNIYLQLSSEKDLQKASQPGGANFKEYTRDNAFLFTQYSSLDFIICAQLIDFAALHVGVNAFKNSQLAAAAVAHIFNKDIATKVSGYTWDDLEPCYTWLIPFTKVLEDTCGSKQGICDSLRTLPECPVNVKAGGGLSYVCPNINLDQSHRIQVHNISLDYFDKVEDLLAANNNCENSVPSCSSDMTNECISETPTKSVPINQTKNELHVNGDALNK